ncbi:FAD-dependent oxidoreductase [Calidifontibacter indicus]|uniref:FAD-dependent oxidoreductase n=1 Tax=Calidifontibacter indicus TaxID=419650 RepID=UPI003D75F098
MLTPLARHLGPETTTPVSWHENAWHLDEFSGGGYAALPGPGATRAQFPFAHDSVGPIRWAGTETATEHPGYIEGAIESGERVAAEVRTALVMVAS